MTDPRLRVELQVQPRVEGVGAPASGGTAASEFVIRNADAASYAALPVRGRRA